MHTHVAAHHDYAANECNPAYKNKRFVLQTQTLQSMTNVFTHQSGNVRTYLYVPATQTGNLGQELFSRSNGDVSGVNHAEDLMYKDLHDNLPQEFWLTNTPCPGCARNLMERYAKYRVKPIIRVVHFYSRPPNGPAEQEKAIECLAKMMHDGFQFLLWDWTKFSNDFLVTPECKKVVSDATTTYSNNLKQEIAATTTALLKASNYAADIGEEDSQVHPDELCQP